MVAVMPPGPGAASAGTWSVTDDPTQFRVSPPGNPAVQPVIVTWSGLGSGEEKETVTESPGLAEFGVASPLNSGFCCDPPNQDAAVESASSPAQVAAPVGKTGRTTTAKITANIADRRCIQRDSVPREFPAMCYRLTKATSV
jgi:hypothetical protein